MDSVYDAYVYGLYSTYYLHVLNSCWDTQGWIANYKLIAPTLRRGKSRTAQRGCREQWSRDSPVRDDASRSEAWLPLIASLLSVATTFSCSYRLRFNLRPKVSRLDFPVNAPIICCTTL